MPHLNGAAASPVAVYVHIPFCPAKCGYCDFNSYAMSGEIVRRTMDAIVSEVKRSPHAGRPASTIFFGGGTPTFVPTEALLELLEAVTSCHPPIYECEITSEANPGTADAEKLQAMRCAGFNRLSKVSTKRNSLRSTECTVRKTFTARSPWLARRVSRI